MNQDRDRQDVECLLEANHWKTESNTSSNASSHELGDSEDSLPWVFTSLVFGVPEKLEAGRNRPRRICSAENKSSEGDCSTNTGSSELPPTFSAKAMASATSTRSLLARDGPATGSVAIDADAAASGGAAVPYCNSHTPRSVLSTLVSMLASPSPCTAVPVVPKPICQRRKSKPETTPSEMKSAETAPRSTAPMSIRPPTTLSKAKPLWS